MPYSPRGGGPQSSSSSPRRRVYWIIVDGLGYRIADLAMQRGSFTSLDRIRREGYLGPLDPPPPNCQTPPALWALFSGLGSTESGIWGYNAPNYQGRLSQSVCGFALRPKDGVPIWAELEQRGLRYSLVNAAFRHDPVWTEEYRNFDLLFDGYRNMRSEWLARSLPLAGDRWRRGVQGFQFLGTRLNASRHGAQVQLHRRGRLLAAAGPGEAATLQIGEAVEATLLHAGDGNLFLFPHYKPCVRLGEGKGEGGDSLSIPERLIDGNIFRQARAAAEAAASGVGLPMDPASRDRQILGSIPIGEEMRIGEGALDDVVNVSLAAARNLSSDLFVFYVSLFDDICHAYMDEIEDAWGEMSGVGGDRGALVLKRCAEHLDRFVREIMDIAALEPPTCETLVVVCADHGQKPFRRSLAVNELFARHGLVRRNGRISRLGLGRGGYDLDRSVAYYHPAGCGHVVLNQAIMRRRGLDRGEVFRRVERIVDEAGSAHGVPLAVLPAGSEDPYLCFLYPRTDASVSGKPPDGAPGTAVVDPTRRGGQHLTPLSGSSWIPALFGAWSPDAEAAGEALREAPARSVDVKDYLLEYLTHCP